MVPLETRITEHTRLGAGVSEHRRALTWPFCIGYVYHIHLHLAPIYDSANSNCFGTCTKDVGRSLRRSWRKTLRVFSDRNPASRISGCGCRVNFYLFTYAGRLHCSPSVGKLKSCDRHSRLLSSGYSGEYSTCGRVHYGTNNHYARLFVDRQKTWSI